METPLRTDLQLLCVELHVSTPYYEHGETHTCHELVYVVHGRHLVEYGRQRVVGEEQDFFYHPPDCPHRPRHDQMAGQTLFLVQWTEPLTSQTMQRPRHGHDASGRALMLLQWMWDLQLHGDSRGRDLLRSLLQALIATTLADDGGRTGVVSTIRHFVVHHLQEPLGLDRLASVAGMSKFQLIRVFHQVAGVTPMQYVQRIRLDAAIHLLKTTSLPVQEVAARVGIANPFHLSRLVRQHTGMAPRDLRRQAEIP